MDQGKAQNARALIVSIIGLVALAASSPATSQPARVHSSAVQARGGDFTSIAEFQRRAGLEHDLGATQMSVTDGLPIDYSELDPDDPYPAWFAHHASLFKTFPPAALRPYVDMAHARRAQQMVSERCRVLAANGLVAVWSANEPAILPEAFFVAYPQYRGARIDQPNRSRKVYFAPNVDHPDVLRMYRESVTDLIRACPQIDTFLWVTTDAGSGFAWTPGLYPGANGNSDGAEHSTAARVAGFMTNIEDAATAAGRPVRINITQIEPRQWMLPTFSEDVLENIVRHLPRGLAVNGHEGPDGRAFDTGMARPAANPFYPIVGLSVPSFDPVRSNSAERRGFPLGDDASVDFNYRLYRATKDTPMSTALQRLQALRGFAASEAGEAQADNLIEAWRALDDVSGDLNTLNFGGMLRFGHVLNRWVSRPMVPYPLELTAQEKADYRPFLFQAHGEAQAANLADIQAMDMYQGWGAHLLFQRTIELAMPRAERARALIDGIAVSAPVEKRAQWVLMSQRIQALIYLMRSADDMVSYQAQLDRVTALHTPPEENPVLGAQSDWARTDMINLARREIDTSIALDALLGQAAGPILDLAPTPDRETIMRLGPNIREALDRKVRTMNAHWRDYDRLFTAPNP